MSCLPRVRASNKAALLIFVLTQIHGSAVEEAAEDPYGKCALLQHSADVYVRALRPSRTAGGSVPAAAQTGEAVATAAGSSRHAHMPSGGIAKDGAKGAAGGQQRVTKWTEHDPELWSPDADGLQDDVASGLFVAGFALMCVLLMWVLLLSVVLLGGEAEKVPKGSSPEDSNEPRQCSNMSMRAKLGEEQTEASSSGQAHCSVRQDSTGADATRQSAACLFCWPQQASFSDLLFLPCERCWQQATEASDPGYLVNLLLTDSS